MRPTDEMVRAALAVLEGHGWEMDDELAGEVREALEAALAVKPNGRADTKRAAALRSRREWMERAKAQERKGR